jgi:hypothetical protein
VALDESNPPSFVLVMVFFLMFLSFPWCNSWWIEPPPSLSYVHDGPLLILVLFLVFFYPFPSGSNLPKFPMIHFLCSWTWNCGIIISGRTTKLPFM